MSSTNDVMAAALLAGKDRKMRNTTVSSGRMFYRDHMIVTRPSPTILRVSLAGYRTHTTVDKINSVLVAAKAGYTITRGGELRSADGSTVVYLGSKEWIAIPIPATPTT